MRILQEQKSVSLREKARACPGLDPGMRGWRSNTYGVYYPLTPTLSLRERGVNKLLDLTAG
jgi:hypothetical protein